MDSRWGLSQCKIFFSEILGLGPAANAALWGFVAFALALAGFWFVHSGPPKMILLTGGPPGSIFEKNAKLYAKILARSGVKVNMLPSDGSLENLKRLADPKFQVDAGFVQGGETQDVNISQLVSLGSLYNQPLLLFYRGDKSEERLSFFSGKRLAIGPVGSGGRSLALAVLDANGIQAGGKTRIESMEAEDSGKALVDGRVDAAFVTGDFAPPSLIRKLFRDKRLRLFNFVQADAYIRHLPYLHKMDLPRAFIDLGRDIPSQDMRLIGPTVELIARKGLHPALSDLLLDAAREIHSPPGLFRKQGEFPAPQEREIRLSPESVRYFKSGKSFFYRSLPFWLASLVNRVLMVGIPLLFLLVPGLKLVPSAYRWRINLKLFRWYRALLEVEQQMISHPDPGDRSRFEIQLDEIENSVNQMKIPPPFAGQFYELRGHIQFVRKQFIKQ